jgi:hypothetical protein
MIGHGGADCVCRRPASGRAIGLGKPLRFWTERGSLRGKTRFSRRKSLLKAPKNGPKALLFLPRNERFQGFSANFPSDLRRDHVHRRGRREDDLRCAGFGRTGHKGLRFDASGHHTRQFSKREPFSLLSEFIGPSAGSRPSIQAAQSSFRSSSPMREQTRRSASSTGSKPWPQALQAAHPRSLRRSSWSQSLLSVFG